MALNALYRTASASSRTSTGRSRKNFSHRDVELGDSISGTNFDLGLDEDSISNMLGESYAGLAHVSMPDQKRPVLTKRISVGQTLAEDKADHHRFLLHRKLSFLRITKLQFYGFIVPMFISLWYATAVFFPPETRKGKLSYILWTEGGLVNNKDGKPTICPRASICSEGILQLILIALARLSAFASYVTMGITFATKMHCSIHYLASTYINNWIPFEGLHSVHKHLGVLYSGLALLHTIVHLVRWGVRSELQSQSATETGVSGYLAMTFMCIIVFCMSPSAKKIKWIAFENRLTMHWLFILLIAALCFHTERTRIISLIFGGLWGLDYAYGLIFRTHRLDVVEFYPLPDMAGTQMLWRNPQGFSCKSGEYVKIRIPWNSIGGDQWHPFSLYLKEATEEGDSELARDGGMTKHDVKKFLKEKRLSQREISLFTGSLKGKMSINPETTALLLVEMQNEYVSPTGKLHDTVKDVMQNNNMLENLSNLADIARDAGLHIFHAPMIVSPDKEIDRDVHFYRTQSLFQENTWNAEFADQFKPKDSDCIVTNKTGSNCFHGSNLAQLISEKNIETLIVGGFTSNGSVESTLFAADEQELNCIMLIDGTASTNMEIQNSTACQLVSSVMDCEEVSKLIETDESEFSVPLVEKLSDTQRQAEKQPDQAKLQKDSGLRLESFIDKFLAQPHEEERFIVKEARQDLYKLYNTSQVFISPEGDWTKGVNRGVRERRQLQTCWVRGPYTSPYFIATQFRHLVLIASGIGITPALGVMGQYPGLSRTKVLIWMVRSKVMLKFFTPLLKDTHIALVFYTGKEKLTDEELHNFEKLNNIYVQQTRPESLGDTIERVIIRFENAFDQRNPCNSVENYNDNDDSNAWKQYHLKLDSVEKRHRESWCVMYCGGSISVKTLLKKFSEEHSLGFKSEFFNW